ncbi:MAG: hypothetical protein ACXAEU_09070 [Candidatus Hodarchaeales archaeon]|jgi:phosphonate metabolism protein PhnN/1,5-bisphosphokinase (PRPP-forming)
MKIDELKDPIAYNDNTGRKLILVVGSSGSGKDTLIYEAAHSLFSSEIQVKIARRWITRPMHRSEDFHSVSVDEFLEAEQMGKFVFSWFIYDIHYGIPSDIIEWFSKDQVVLVNVSRGILFEARKRYPSCKIIKIVVPTEIAEKRVRSRGRERGSKVEERIHRMKREVPMPDPDLVIENIYLEESVHTLVSYVRSLYP